MERVERGAPDDGRIEQAGCDDFVGHGRNSAQKVLPACIRKCSTTGPSARAGKYWSRYRMTMTPSSSPTNKGPSVGKVPAEAGAFFLAAKEPAKASTGITWAKRPRTVAGRSVVLNQGVLPLRPARAEPLFALVEAKA